MNSLCEICGENPDIREILVCCWKSVCAKHKFEFCTLCSKLCTRLPHIICSCQRCQTNSISYYCEICKSYLCSVCSESVHEKGKYSAHKLKAQTQGVPNTCAKHSMPIFSFCSVCGLCCFNCACPHKKVKIQETEKISKALQEKYCKTLVLKIRSLKITEKTAFKAFNTTLASLESLIADVKNEFNDTVKLILEKKEALLKHYSTLIDEYSIKSKKVLADLSLDLSRSIDLYNLFSIPVPINALVLSLPETVLSEVLETLEYKLPEIDTSIRVNLNTINQSIRTLSFDKTEVFESPKVLSPRLSLSKDYGHKRLESQDLPPRPSVGRSSIINRQNSGKFISARSPRNSEELVLKECLSKRTFIDTSQTASSVKLSWTHPSNVVENLEYALECSLDGSDFKLVYRGKPKTCIITDLPSDTLYYFKVYPVAGETRGEVSEVLEICTFAEE